MSEEVQLEFSGDARELKSALDESERGINRFGNGAMDMAKAIGAVWVFDKVFGGLMGGMSGMFAAWDEATRGEVRLEAAIKATGGAAGFTGDQMKQMAADLQETINVEDDATISTMAMMSTMKNVRGDVFKDVLRLGADMATVLGQDAAGATQILARAMNDPERGMMLLRRAGVELTDQQREQIKVLKESGDMMGAQRVILDELEKTFAGAAESMAKSLPGRMDALKIKFGNMGETIVGAFVPAMEMMMPLFDKGAQAVENMTELLPPMMEWIGGIASSIWDEVKPAVDWFGGEMNERFVAVQMTLETMWEVVESVLSAMGTSVKGLGGGAVDAFKIFEGAVTDLLVGSLLVAQVAIENFEEAWKVGYTSIALGMVETGEDVKHILTKVLPDVMSWFARNWQDIFHDLQSFQNTVLLNMGKNVWDFVKEVKNALMGRGFNMKFTALTEGFEATLKELPEIAERTKTETERILQEQLDVSKDNLLDAYDEKRRAFEERAKANKDALAGLFDKAEQERVDLEDTASEEYAASADAELKAQKELEKATKARAENAKKAADEGSEGGMEALEALARRIQENAAKNMTEQDAVVDPLKNPELVRDKKPGLANLFEDLDDENQRKKRELVAATGLDAGASADDAELDEVRRGLASGPVAPAPEEITEDNIGGMFDLGPGGGGVGMPRIPSLMGEDDEEDRLDFSLSPENSGIGDPSLPGFGEDVVPDSFARDERGSDTSFAESVQATRENTGVLTRLLDAMTGTRDAMMDNAKHTKKISENVPIIGGLG